LPPSDDCVPPPCTYSKLTAPEFDAWLALRLGDFQAVQAVLDRSNETWAAERAQWRALVERGADDPGRHASDVKRWLARENAFYQQTYLAVAWEGRFVWGLYVAEASGLRNFGGAPSSQGPDGKFHALAPGFGGLAQRDATRANLAVGPLYQRMLAAGCRLSKTVERRRRLTQQDPGFVDAEAAINAAAALYVEARRDCRAAEDAQRDAYRDPLLALRDRLASARGALAARLDAWRAFGISSHLYEGEGDAAIYAVYGDGSAAALDSASTLYLPYSTRPGPESAAALVRVPMTNTLPGASLGETKAGRLTGQLFARVSNSCYQVPGTTWPTGMTSVSLDELRPAVKYPDIEFEPFGFLVEVARDPKIAEGAAFGASDLQSP
jgi:hypothetical protein